VQKLGTYRIDFDLEVPMESTGCYVKFTFPRELKVSSSDLKTFTGRSLLGNGRRESNRIPE
jgi:hypothetical protein